MKAFSTSRLLPYEKIKKVHEGNPETIHEVISHHCVRIHGHFNQDMGDCIITKSIESQFMFRLGR